MCFPSSNRKRPMSFLGIDVMQEYSTKMTPVISRWLSGQPHCNISATANGPCDCSFLNITLQPERPLEYCSRSSDSWSIQELWFHVTIGWPWKRSHWQKNNYCKKEVWVIYKKKKRPSSGPDRMHVCVCCRGIPSVYNFWFLCSLILFVELI